jgi:hypothetical protein
MTRKVESGQKTVTAFLGISNREDNVFFVGFIHFLL